MGYLKVKAITNPKRTNEFQNKLMKRFLMNKG